MIPLGILAATTAAIANSYWESYIASPIALGSRSSQAIGSAFDSGLNCYVVGYGYITTTGGNTTYLAKYDNSGSMQWQRTLTDTNTTFTNTQSKGIASNGAGDAFICGLRRHTSDTGYNAFIAKYNSAGTIQWQRTLSGSAASASQADIASGINIDSSDNAYIAGGFINASGGYNAFISKYDASGAIQWQRSLADANTAATQGTLASSVGIDSTGNIYVAGYFKNTSGGYVTFVAKYNSSGTIQWQRTLADGNTAASQSTTASAIGVDSAGNVYVAGNTANIGGTAGNAFLVKYNSAGILQWQRLVTGTASGVGTSDIGRSISIDSSGSIYLAGSTRTSGTNYLAFIAKYNSSGVLQWQRTMTDTSTSNFAIGYGISVNGNQNITLTGNTHLTNWTSTDSFVLKVPNDGTKTGTYTVDSEHGFIYAIGSLTDSVGSLTDAAGSLTAATSTLTDTAGSMVEAAGTFTYAKLAL